MLVRKIVPQSNLKQRCTTSALLSEEEILDMFPVALGLPSLSPSYERVRRVFSVYRVSFSKGRRWPYLRYS